MFLPVMVSPGVPVFSGRVGETRAFSRLLVPESEPETVPGGAVRARTGVRSPFKNGGSVWGATSVSRGRVAASVPSTRSEGPRS
jgi:hypothetical protein